MRLLGQGTGGDDQFHSASEEEQRGEHDLNGPEAGVGLHCRISYRRVWVGSTQATNGELRDRQALSGKREAGRGKREAERGKREPGRGFPVTIARPSSRLAALGFA